MLRVLHQYPAVHARRVVAFQDTKKQGASADYLNLQQCVCQGSMFSKSAFSVGRAVDTDQGSCGSGIEGIVVTGASDIFTRVVENPVQAVLPLGFMNEEKGSDGFRPLSPDINPDTVFWPDLEDYYSTENVPGYPLAAIKPIFMIADRNLKGMNGQATDVQIQWLEVPDSVSLTEILDAKLFGAQQISPCPSEGSAFTPIAAAGMKCVMESIYGQQNCSDPGAKKMLVGCLIVCSGR